MKKLMILGILIAMLSILTVSQVSAVMPNVAPYANGIAYGYGSYGSYPVNPSLSGRYYPYTQTPVRVGGFFGANSAYLIDLKPGFYDGPIQNSYTRGYLSSSYYPRVGGWFGQGGYLNYYSLRPDTFTYYGRGMGTGYSGAGYGYIGPL